MLAGRSDSIVGRINGPVSLDAQHYRFWGWKVLAPLLVIAGVAMLLGAAGSGQGTIGTGLFPLLLVFVVLVVILGTAVGFNFKRMMHAMGSGSVGMAKKTVVLGGHGLAAGTRGAVGMATSGSISEQSLTVRRFRVQSPLGQTQACVMVGELQGDELRQGDMVRVYGRQHRDGHRNTRKVEIIQSAAGPVSSTVLARRPASFMGPWVFDKAAKWASLVIACLMLIALYQALS